MALNPAATNASSSVNVVGSSAVQPITFPPKTRGGISRLELPSLRFFISILSMLALQISARTLHETEREWYTRNPGAESVPRNILTIVAGPQPDLVLSGAPEGRHNVAHCGSGGAQRILFHSPVGAAQCRSEEH